MLEIRHAAPTFNLSGGLELHPLTPPYAHPLFQIVENYRDALRRWQNWPDRIRTQHHMRDLIRHSQRKTRDHHGYDWVIVQGGIPAGKIGLLFIDWKKSFTEIGYWLAPPFQKRGLMTRACHRVVDFAFNQLHLETVHIRCAEGNRPSRAIPERLGFENAGRLPYPTDIHGQPHYELKYRIHAKDWNNRMIYHITTRAEWEAAQDTGTYTAPSLEDQGFIHLSATPDQTQRVANAIFSRQQGLVVLVVDPARLRAELRYEPPDTGIHADEYDGELFPHLYGPLDLAAVVDVLDYPANPDGTFDLLEP